ncbi:MAG: hypothetical protein K1X89_04740 [Myxococcaceae bacterium]|nr:hypothetical protein [Myxococcaceae bacterium]
MVAVGTVAVFTMAVLVGYSSSRADAETQTASRYQRQAFFAAEAALAEARGRLTTVVAGAGTFNSAFVAANIATDIGAGSASVPTNDNIWYEVLGGSQSGQCIHADSNSPSWCQVDLSYTSTEATAMGFNNRAAALPNPVNIKYRVFLRDDADEGVPDYTVDANGVARLIAVGEVQRPNGTVLARQAIVTYIKADGVTVGGPANYSQGGQGADKNSRSSDLNPASVAAVTAGF